MLYKVLLLVNASITLKTSIATFDCRKYWTRSVGLLRSVLSHFYLTFWTLKLKAATSTSQLCGMLQRRTKEMLTGKPPENTMYIYSPVFDRGSCPHDLRRFVIALNRFFLWCPKWLTSMCTCAGMYGLLQASSQNLRKRSVLVDLGIRLW